MLLLVFAGATAAVALLLATQAARGQRARAEELAALREQVRTLAGRLVRLEQGAVHAGGEPAAAGTVATPDPPPSPRGSRTVH